MDEQPFRGRRAVRRGALTEYQLRTRYRALHRDVYVPDGLELTAAVLGTRWLDAAQPAELVRADRHGPSNIVVRTHELGPEDVCVVSGMRVTASTRRRIV